MPWADWADAELSGPGVGGHPAGDPGRGAQTERLVWVDVLWVLRNVEGRIAGHERTGYLLRLEAGTTGIQVVVPRPVPEPLPTA